MDLFGSICFNISVNFIDRVDFIRDFIIGGI